MAAVFTELQRLGWVNGRNAIYEPRYSAGDPSRFPGFVTDLVDRKVNVIFAGNHAAAKAAQIATATIPIVALAAEDMEEAGLVASIARSASNITGVSMFGAELDEKRFELLMEMVPAHGEWQPSQVRRGDPPLPRSPLVRTGLVLNSS
jgi:putative ABC transport system substrate-binding protein